MQQSSRLVQRAGAEGEVACSHTKALARLAADPHDVMWLQRIRRELAPNNRVSSHMAGLPIQPLPRGYFRSIYRPPRPVVVVRTARRATRPARICDAPRRKERPSDVAFGSAFG
jgi:hypothetical protein